MATWRSYRRGRGAECKKMRSVSDTLPKSHGFVTDCLTLDVKDRPEELDFEPPDGGFRL